MTSKESLELAIEEYEKDLEYDVNNQWVKTVLKGLKEVKQNLERLEKLESELKRKSGIICMLESENESLHTKNESLQSENKNLKEEMRMYINTNNNLYKESKKLKKVIEILKINQVSIHVLLETNSVEEYNFCVNYNQLLTKEEYELLKEFLKNENNR